MADILQTGLAWLASTRAAQMSQTGYYITRDGGRATLSVTLGSTGVSVLGVEGQEVQGRQLDLIVNAADLLINGVAHAPEIGDRVIVGGETYEVLAIPGGEHYRRCDGLGTMLRIHVKQIK